MDGGVKQKLKAEDLKNTIKLNAEHQRERDAGFAGVGGGLSFIVEPQCATKAGQLIIETDQDGVSLETTPSSMASHSVLYSAIYQTPSTSDDPATLEHFETAFLTKYFDDVFPFLFPFYRPSILETGRYWILSLLKHSDVARHAALGLCTYFATVRMQETYSGRFEPCKKQLWDRLSQQVDGYFKQIQIEVQQLRLQAGGATDQDRVRSMHSIFQVLLFEVALGKTKSWDVHLTAALGLFDEMYCTSTKHEAVPSFMSLLGGLGKPAWSIHDIDSPIWNTEQAGFRFLTALLIYLDVVGSTATELSPRLLNDYSVLLADTDESDHTNQSLKLQLSAYVGCENWVIAAIGETAALTKWKKDAQSHGCLSMPALVERAKRIEEALEKGIARLDARSRGSKNIKETDLFASYGRSPPPVTTELTTAIWAQAARIYLAVVVSGWQPCNATIRTGVRKSLELLQGIKSPCHLHALKWPFVVAGCMAEPGEEQHQYMVVLNHNYEMGMYGVMKEAQDILIKTWEERKASSWDEEYLASCLRILGHPVLLV
jgi:hypothetical protein